MGVSSVPNFGASWQKKVFESKQAGALNVQQTAVSTLSAFLKEPDTPKPLEGLKKIEEVAQANRLSTFQRLVYRIASWITQYIFCSHHAFYESILTLDWKMKVVIDLGHQLREAKTTTGVHEKVQAGQLVDFLALESKPELLAFYKDIKAAHKLAKVLANLKQLKSIATSKDLSPSQFNKLDTDFKNALIEIAERATNHALADQIRNLKKLNPVVLRQFCDGEPSLIDLALKDYEDLQNLLLKRYGILTGSNEEQAQKLFVPGALSKVFNAELSDVYDVSINRLASVDQIETIFQKSQESVIRVTHVGVEYASFLKQGGLGEALEGLAEAMQADGAQVRVLFPLYSSFKDKILDCKDALEASFVTAIGEHVKTYTLIHKGVEIVFIDHEDFKLDSASPNIYDGDISSRSRFARFCQCASSWLYQNKDQIDVIHLHDWHVATIAKTLATDYPQAWQEGQMSCVFTAHNNSRAAQGRCVDELAVAAYSYGLGLNPMLEALRWSDMVTTVSEVFAREIQVPERGEGLDPVMRRLAVEGRLVGILNGSNPGKWNPASDAQLKEWALTPSSEKEDLTCSVQNPQKVYEKKRRAKELLALWIDQQRVLLEDIEETASEDEDQDSDEIAEDHQKPTYKQLLNSIDPQKTLFGVVTRYDSYQKGLDCYEAMIDGVLKEGGQILLVGSQEDHVATQILDKLVKKHKSTPGVAILRDEKIEGGGYRYQGGSATNAPIGSIARLAIDVMFMTPRYEPSGLTQFEGWAYGSLVFASATGGLAESVTTPEKNPKNFNGWLFNRALGEKDLCRALSQAMSYFQSATVQDRVEKIAFVMNEATSYGWSCSTRRISPVKQYFTVYDQARKNSKSRQKVLTHTLMDRFRTVDMPVLEPMAKLNSRESQMALRAFIGAGNCSPVEMKGPLARSMPVAFGEGICKTLHKQLGPQKMADGTFRLTVNAPNAKFVSVVIYKNDGTAQSTFPLVKYEGGIWQTGLDLPSGTMYHLAIDGAIKIDPYARHQARLDSRKPMVSVLYHDDFKWTDQIYMENRRATNKLATANMLEVFPQTWAAERGLRTWDELAPSLIAYARTYGFTHVELMGVLPFPCAQSMGYQAVSHFSTDYRLGTPENFKKLINALHEEGIGVVVDFIPGHISKDEWGMAHFDGSALYEISGMQKWSAQAIAFRWGHHMNFGSQFVQAHFLSSANWLMEQHVDGLRVDAVRSMLNHYDPDAAKMFLQHLNSLVHQHPGCFTIAEDYSCASHVIKPLENKGLGFTGRWNIGWKHHAMKLLKQNPGAKDSYSLSTLVLKQSQEGAIREVKYISHDEVSPGAGSLLEMVDAGKQKSSQDQMVSRCAKLASFIAFMRLLPGPSLMFMGIESLSNYKWSCQDPSLHHRERVDSPFIASDYIDSETRATFYRELQDVIQKIGEQVSCSMKHTADDKPAVTYELSGKKMTVFVMANFSNRLYLSALSELDSPFAEPLSIKVIKIDESKKQSETLWDTSKLIHAL